MIFPSRKSQDLKFCFWVFSDMLNRLVIVSTAKNTVSSSIALVSKKIIVEGIEKLNSEINYRVLVSQRFSFVFQPFDY
jgi:DNA helicase TIP49 (TBP-interacting protein)